MKRWIWLLSLLFVPLPGLLAQTGNGSLRGSVQDPSEAAVPGATLIVRNMDTGLILTAKTSGAGIYELPNVPPGRYEVTVTAAGFNKFMQSGVTVEVGTTSHLDIRLQLGTVTQQVVVAANAPLLRPDTPTMSTTISSQFVENLPLDVAGTLRNPVQFIELTPGFRGSVGNDPGNNADDNFKMNGGQSQGTDILVDGVSISLASANLQWNKGISTESVSEFTTLQNNFSAEYGESGDAVVSLSMKSGTNQLHGSVYDYLRNEALNANNWANNLLGVPRPPDKQNDFGFSVGGPVVIPRLYKGRDRTFFFFDYEGYRFHIGSTSIDTFPPEAFRRGDFSLLLPSIQLYDPTTHQPIPGNILSNDPNFVPSKVITNLFNSFPATDGGLTNNSTERAESFTRADVWDLKIDQNVSDRQHISSSFSYDNTNSGNTSSLGPEYAGTGPQNTRYARFSDSYTFTPTLFNLFNAGFTRRYRGELAGSIGQNWPEKLGLTGVQNTTYPCFNFNDSAYSWLPSCGDSEFADNVYQLNDAVTLVHGKHTIKLGGEFRGLQFNVRRLTGVSGIFYFDPGETSFDGVGGYSLASALFGLVHQATLPYGSFSGIRYKDFSFFGQDSYKVTSRLNLNYGLRYDVNLPATEAFDRFSVVDPTLPNPGAGNIPGAYTYFGVGPGRNGRKRPQNVYTKAFSPRIGLAYRINDKTVIRTGYGIYYEPNKENSFADQDGLGFFNTETLTTGLGAPFQIDNGVPHLFPPSGPLIPEGQNGNSGVIMVPPNSGRPGDIQNWNFDVQRQIAVNLLIDVAYVGSKGTHLPALNIIPNQVNPRWLSLGPELGMDISCMNDGSCPNAVGAGVKSPFAGFSGTVAQALRPFPQYGDFQQEDNSFTPDRTGNSTYHSLQVQLNKRFSEGLIFLVSYTISKNITDADSMAPGAAGFIGNNAYIGQNSYDRKAEKGLSELDIPQRLVASYFYELPFGRGKRFLNHLGRLTPIVSGWYVSGIHTYESGTPLAVYGPCSGTAGDVLFAGCAFTGIARVNVTPGVPLTNKSSHFQPAVTPFYNENAFSLAAPYTFGDEPRALNARAFSSLNEAIVIGKKTALLGERLSLNFRAEFFDAFNRHIYSAPGGFDAPLGQPFLPVGSPGCPGPLACGFGAVTGASGPRTIQFGLKITY